MEPGQNLEPGNRRTQCKGELFTRVSTVPQQPGVRLVILHPATRSVTAPILDFLGSPEIRAHRQVLVLLPEVEPSKWRHRILQNQRDIILANALRWHSNVNVASVPFRLTDG